MTSASPRRCRPIPDAIVAGADAVLADNRFPLFVRPVCEAGRRRKIPVVLDGDKATVEDDPLFRICSHVVFSSECLRATTGVTDLAEGLKRIARHSDAFLAVSNGPGDIVVLEQRRAAHGAGFPDSGGGYAWGR